jgi:hypothetical protein
MCEDISERNITSLSYKESSLLRYFRKYSDCKNIKYKIYDEFSDKKGFSFKLKAGISYTSFNVDRVGIDLFRYSYQIKYDAKITPVFGFEIEYFLPIKGNKWSVYVDPKYRSFSGKKNVETFPNRTQDVEVSYRAIEIPINLRYYKYLDSGSAFSLNAGFSFAENMNSNIDFEISNLLFEELSEVNTTIIPIFGIGYHREKYTLELTYSNRNILRTSPLFTSDFNTLDLSLSYTLF